MRIKRNIKVLRTLLNTDHVFVIVAVTMKRSNTSRRDFISIVNDVLRGISRDLSTTRTMMSCRINVIYMKRVISMMIERGLIEINNQASRSTRVRYRPTERGLKLMDLLAGIERIQASNGHSHSNDHTLDVRLIRNEALDIARVISLKKRRERVEIMYLIMSTLIDGPKTRVSIASSCCLNAEQVSTYIDELLSYGMIQEIITECKTKYSLTKKGEEFISLFLNIYRLLYY